MTQVTIKDIFLVIDRGIVAGKRLYDISTEVFALLSPQPGGSADAEIAELFAPFIAAAERYHADGWDAEVGSIDEIELIKPGDLYRLAEWAKRHLRTTPPSASLAVPTVSPSAARTPGTEEHCVQCDLIIDGGCIADEVGFYKYCDNEHCPVPMCGTAAKASPAPLLDAGVVDTIRLRHEEIVRAYGDEPWDEHSAEDGEQAHKDRATLLRLIRGSAPPSGGWRTDEDAAVRTPTWRPIDTAPKDGTVVPRVRRPMANGLSLASSCPSMVLRVAQL